jgi:hypothetical protein
VRPLSSLGPTDAGGDGGGVNDRIPSLFTSIPVGPLEADRFCVRLAGVEGLGRGS